MAGMEGQCGNTSSFSVGRHADRKQRMHAVILCDSDVTGTDWRNETFTPCRVVYTTTDSLAE